MPSFDSVNYSIRTNKAVERRIVFSSLIKLSRLVKLSSFRFIGFGSLWFIDFLMAHRLLRISSMISIENSEIGYKRAEFNRPLACIKMLKGESTQVIPKLLELEKSESIVWFDYDTGIAGPVLEDISLMVARCVTNSIVVVTINGKMDDLPNKDEDGLPLDPEAGLRRVAGDLVPTPLPARSLQRQRFPKLLCEIVYNQFVNSAVSSGRTDCFVKLFDIVYSDGTPMVTIGGIFVSSEDAIRVKELVVSPEWEAIVDETIAVPPLTPKEKMALDRLMPSTVAPSDAQMEEIGFQLKRAQIDTFHRHYLHYPVFGELAW